MFAVDMRAQKDLKPGRDVEKVSAEDAERPERHYPGAGTVEDPFIVDWALGDAENPFNWSIARKWLITSHVRPSLKRPIIVLIIP